MDGLGMLLENLYGVKLEYVQPGYGELWSYDVHKLVSNIWVGIARDFI